ncbi:MAG: PH domain-containing protein [Candidatus Helarchaeota archaeon]|nr:PH domain-containing protein [Candidatus Helarchaeota archaeon]
MRKTDQIIDEDYKKVLKLKLTLKYFLIIAPIPISITILFGILNFYLTLPLLWLQIALFISLGILIGIPILGYVIASIWAIKWFENYSFKLEDEGVKIYSGVITKSQKFIPYNKIQNVELVSGFFERHFGLSTIQLETAGYTGGYRGPYPRPEGLIPGLRDPEPIMDEICAKTGKYS